MNIVHYKNILRREMSALVQNDGRAAFEKSLTNEETGMRKRICSLCGVLCTILFMVHGIYAGILMISHAAPAKILLVLGRGVLTVLAVHALLGFPFVLYRMAAGKKLYIRENRSTLLQLVSGVLLLVFAAVHTNYLIRRPTVPALIFILIMLAFFGVHLFLGLPKACVTLGLLRKEKDMTAAKRISFFIAVLSTVFFMAAFCCYFLQICQG